MRGARTSAGTVLVNTSHSSPQHTHPKGTFSLDGHGNPWEVTPPQSNAPLHTGQRFSHLKIPTGQAWPGLTSPWHQLAFRSEEADLTSHSLLETRDSDFTALQSLEG